MSTLQDAYNAVVDAVIIDPALSRNDAGAIIEAFGPTMTGAESKGWLDEMAAEYDSLGIINNPTWAGLRNGIVNDGDVASKDLADALEARIAELPLTPAVGGAIDLETNEQALLTIPGNIVIIEGNKTGGANQQLDDAYDAGIKYLNDLNAQLSFQNTEITFLLASL